MDINFSSGIISVATKWILWCIDKLGQPIGLYIQVLVILLYMFPHFRY